MNNHSSEAEKVSLVEEGKEIGIMKLLSIMKLLITAQNKKYMQV